MNDAPILVQSSDPVPLSVTTTRACGCALAAVADVAVVAVPCRRHQGQMAVALSPRERWEAFRAWEKGAAA